MEYTNQEGVLENIERLSEIWDQGSYKDHLYA